MLSKLSHLKAYSIIFICLLYPYFYVGHIIVPSVFIVIFGPATFYIFRSKFNTEDFFVFCIFFISLSIIFFSATLNDADFSLRILFLTSIFIFIFYSSKQIVFFCLKHQICIRQLFVIMINIITLNSIFIILLNIGLLNAESFYSIIHTNPRVFTYPIVRYPGFSYDAFSYLSVLNAFALCLLLDEYTNKKINSSIYFYFTASIIFVALVFTGRTGILVFLIYFFIKLTNLNIRILIMLLLSLTTLLMLSLISWGEFEWIKEWAFSFIFNFVSGSSNIDSSVTGVQQHFFLPENILVGDRISFINVQSDLGIIRFINSLGIFGFLIFVVYFTFLLLLAIRSKDQLSIFLIMKLSLLNLKDVYFVSPYGVTFFVLLVVLGKTLSKNGESSEKS